MRGDWGATAHPNLTFRLIHLPCVWLYPNIDGASPPSILPRKPHGVAKVTPAPILCCLVPLSVWMGQSGTPAPPGSALSSPAHFRSSS